MERLTELLIDIRREFPAFQLFPKSESWFMKALGMFLYLITFGRMSTFMNDFTTTIGYTVYTPIGWDERSWQSRAEIIRHERVHMRQRRRWGAWRFSLLYLFVPVPVLWASYRTRFEMDAYEESVRAHVEYFGRDSLNAGFREWLVSQFTGPYYFWMCVRRRHVEKWYAEVLARLPS